MRPPHAPARRGGALALRQRGGGGAQVPRPGLWAAPVLTQGRLPSPNCATAAAAFGVILCATGRLCLLPALLPSFCHVRACLHHGC